MRHEFVSRDDREREVGKESQVREESTKQHFVAEVTDLITHLLPTRVLLSVSRHIPYCCCCCTSSHHQHQHHLKERKSKLKKKKSFYLFFHLNLSPFSRNIKTKIWKKKKSNYFLFLPCHIWRERNTSWAVLVSLYCSPKSSRGTDTPTTGQSKSKRQHLHQPRTCKTTFAWYSKFTLLFLKIKIKSTNKKRLGVWIPIGGRVRVASFELQAENGDRLLVCDDERDSSEGEQNGQDSETHLGCNEHVSSSVRWVSHIVVLKRFPTLLYWCKGCFLCLWSHYIYVYVTPLRRLSRPESLELYIMFELKLIMRENGREHNGGESNQTG